MPVYYTFKRETFAERLKEKRIACGYETAKEFADKVGIKQSTYNSYERGDREPSLDILSDIASVLDVMVDELLPNHEFRYTYRMSCRSLEEALSQDESVSIVCDLYSQGYCAHIKTEDNVHIQFPLLKHSDIEKITAKAVREKYIQIIKSKRQAALKNVHEKLSSEIIEMISEALDIDHNQLVDYARKIHSELIECEFEAHHSVNDIINNLLLFTYFTGISPFDEKTRKEFDDITKINYYNCYVGDDALIHCFSPGTIYNDINQDGIYHHRIREFESNTRYVPDNLFKNKLQNKISEKAREGISYIRKKNIRYLDNIVIFRTFFWDTEWNDMTDTEYYNENYHNLFDHKQQDAFLKMKTLYMNIYDDTLRNAILGNYDWSKYHCKIESVYGEILYDGWYFKSAEGGIILTKKCKVNIDDIDYTDNSFYKITTTEPESREKEFFSRLQKN